MNRLFLFLLLCGLSIYSYSQNKPKKKVLAVSDTTKVSSKKLLSSVSNKPTIDKYLIISRDRDTTYLDTSLTIKKDYKYNYLRKDNFNLIQFANTGQTYNTLSLNKSSVMTLPGFAAQARHFNYLEKEDINYYRVPTPLTGLYYKTVFSQGQNLDAFFTVNISPQLNFSLAYKGLRSLGSYQNTLTSTGNFRFTTNFVSKNTRYKMRGHITFQDLFNEENGGLSDDDVIRFIDGEEEILDRTVFDPNFENAQNTLEGKRFHLDQSYAILSKKDSLRQNDLFIENTFSFQDKFYEYNQTAADIDFFGSSFSNSINDRVTLEEFHSNLGLRYRNEALGDFDFKINFNSINYGYDSLVFLNNQSITNRIKENFFGFVGSYSNQIGRFELESSLGANLSERIKGNFFNASVKFKLAEDLLLIGGINTNSSLPNYNHLLYQSVYTNYNWDNQDDFDNVKSQQLSFEIKSGKIIDASVDITNIENYTYFNLESVQGDNKVIQPRQYTEALQYFRIEIGKELRLGKLALDNTIMYQNVVSNDNVFNVPELIVRNTLYYTDEVFKKALKFQTGVIFNYFSEYNGNGYDPLLAEFFTQNRSTIGGFPRLDFFINAKIRQTRIFIKAEHFNSSFTGYNYFSAPNYPYRDFSVRFGLVWNFFL